MSNHATGRPRVNYGLLSSLFIIYCSLAVTVYMRECGTAFRVTKWLQLRASLTGLKLIISATDTATRDR